MKTTKKPTPLLQGTASLTVSHLFFLGAGYVAQVAIAFFLAPEIYGLFGIVIVTLNLSELVFSTGILRNVTTLIGKDPNNAASVIRRGKTVQYVAIGIVSAVFLLLAGPISTIFHAPELAPYLRVLALMFPIYGVRAFYASVLAGLRLFNRQALHRTIGGVLKLLAIPAVAISGDIYGVLAAYFLATLYLFIAYRFEARRSEKFFSGKGTYPLRPFVIALFPLLAFVGLFPLLQSLDLYFLKALLPTQPELTGFYTAAGTLAKIPFLLFSPLAITLLPSLARTFAKKNQKKLVEYQTKTDGIYLLLLLPMALLPLSGLSDILRLFFPDAYSEAAVALGILLGTIVMSVLYENGLLYYVASERYRRLFLLAIPAPILFTILLLTLIPMHGMIGASSAAFITACIGAFAVRLFLQRDFHLSFPLSRLLRIGPAALLASVGGFLLPLSDQFVILKLMIVGAVYIALLFLFRAIPPDEVAYPKRLLSSFSRSR